MERIYLVLKEISRVSVEIIDYLLLFCFIIHKERQMPETAPSTIPPPKRGTYRRKRRHKGELLPPRKCRYCGDLKKVHFWKSPTEPVCIQCYQKHINVETCSLCGHKKTVRQRDEAGRAICHTCYQRIRPEENCVHCKKPGKIVRRYDDGTGMCNNCYQKKRRARLKAESGQSTKQN